MTRNEAVAMVKQVLGFMQSRDLTIIANMQTQQTKLELMPTKPWFLVEHLASLATVSGQAYVALPTDFLEEYEEGGLYLVDPDSDPVGQLVDIEKDDFDQLTRAFKGEPAGRPAAYALVDDRLWLFPTPDEAFGLKFSYYRKGILLANDVENEWLKWVPELLVGKTARVMAAALRDANAIKLCDDMIRESMMLLENQNEARKHARREMQMGGPQ